jgi:hypothetical protein
MKIMPEFSIQIRISIDQRFVRKEYVSGGCNTALQRTRCQR